MEQQKGTIQVNMILTKTFLNLKDIDLLVEKADPEGARLLYLKELLNIDIGKFPPSIEWIWVNDITSIGRICYNINKDSTERFKIVAQNDTETIAWGLFLNAEHLLSEIKEANPN
jgi:hypothetical protein